MAVTPWQLVTMMAAPTDVVFWPLTRPPDTPTDIVSVQAVREQSAVVDLVRWGEPGIQINNELAIRQVELLLRPYSGSVVVATVQMLAVVDQSGTPALLGLCPVSGTILVGPTAGRARLVLNLLAGQTN